jgi:hypothetical protein
MAMIRGKSRLAVSVCASLLLGARHHAPAASATNAPHASATATNTPANTVAVHTLELGAVRIDKERRTVSFPVMINQRTGVVEYAVVTTSGKTHESVFRTEAQPAHIHLAMLLLGVKPASTNVFSANLSIPPPGEPVTVEVSWRNGRGEIRSALEEFIVAGNDHHTFPKGPWIYNGSYLAQRTFLAQRDGSIISVHIDPDALINNPRPGRENDDLHSVNSAALPAEDLPLKITLHLPTPSPKTKSP